VFGVSWGDPVAATALVGAWALVGTGAGVLSGTLFRTPEQASSIGPSFGIAFGMLGGCMWPLEIVPEAMRTIGHVVPHAWAVDAWTVLLSRGGGLADIALQLLVLTGFAGVLLLLATTRLQRVVHA
jgi:ABC-2 type transport system permease protein